MNAMKITRRGQAKGLVATGAAAGLSGLIRAEARSAAELAGAAALHWADLGLHAGAAETRRIGVRVYGDGSIPFTLAAGELTLRLAWSNGKGHVESGPAFDVWEWKTIG